MQRIGKLAHALLVLSGLIFPGEYLLGITPALAATQESDAQNEKRLIDGRKKGRQARFLDQRLERQRTGANI